MMAPGTGRMLKEDGTTVNLADLFGGTDTGEKQDIDMMMPRNGRFVKEDGSVVNIADIIEDFFAGLSGGGSMQALTLTVDGVRYTYDGTQAQDIPAIKNKKANLFIYIGGKRYVYNGDSSVSVKVPNEALNITLGDTTYTYTGNEQVDINIAAAEGVTF